MKMKACVLIRVVPPKGPTVLDAVKKIPEVKSAYFVFGRYDIVAFVEAPSYDALSTLTSKLHAIAGTKSTETLIEG